jgi:hypothetical protein
MRGETRPFGANRLLGDLDNDFLVFLDPLLNRQVLRRSGAPSSRWPLRERPISRSGVFFTPLYLRSLSCALLLTFVVVLEEPLW